MIIRKVENRAAIGGGSTTGYTATSGLPCAPGEKLGEAVAQFRPMALEIYNDPLKARVGDHSTENTFLACLGDAIGINQSREARQYLNNHGGSSVDEDSPPGSGPSPKGPSRPLPSSHSPSPKLFGSAQMAQSEFGTYDEDQSSHGAKVKRVRRLSSSTNISQMPYSLGQSSSRPPSSLAKHRKRGQSLNSLAQFTDSSSDDEPLPRVWSLDCGGAPFPFPPPFLHEMSD